ncbi:UPF0449 family protein [Haloplanus halobius]|uniref:UPF0449 family protein n=1 Tax=Haloplanus halobius TaxID=2934938 RepID=UPI00200CE735|nr:UPF0449 family protein [Haloplanus sp. XH21]
MSSNDTKHLQTELTEDEYERFRKYAREHGLSLKGTGHQALIEWIERQQQADPNDPAFTLLDDLEDEPLPASAATDAREEADLVDEWHGSDESFRLVDDPSPQPDTDE